MAVSRLAILIFFLASLVLSPLRAHHSFFAEFDEKRPVMVTGTIAKVEWENPQVWYYLDVKDGDGKITTWGLLHERAGAVDAQRPHERHAQARSVNYS
jgi:hypothetical protein